MNWTLLALLAPFVYAVNIYIDKYLVSSRLRDFRSLPVFSAIVAFIFAILLWIFTGFEILSSYDAFLVLLSGVFTIVGFALYLEALMKEETSLLIVLIQLSPVFVLVLSYIFLSEVITGQQFLGFLLLLTASVGATLKKEKSSWKLSKAVVYILLADLIWSSAYILIKLASADVALSSLIIYESWGVVIGGVLLFLLLPGIRKAFIDTARKLKPLDFGLIMFNEFLYLGGKALTYMAVALGPVALVSIIGSTQIFYGIVFGAVLTIILPKVFKEDLSRGGIVKKFVLGGIAIFGIVLVS